ncbi:MCP four helix bundle domain-containing protein, partial [Achromobacter insolitus]
MLRFFSALRIGARLSGAFLLVAVIGGAIGAFGVWGLARINEMNDRLYDTELRGISDIKEANINLIYAGRARNGYLAASTDQERQALRKQFDDAVANMDGLREKAAANFYSEEGKRLLAQFT